MKSTKHLLSNKFLLISIAFLSRKYDRIVFNSFYDVRLIIQLYEDITRKENYSPTLLINTDMSILNKILANQTPKYVKMIIFQNQVSCILQMQGSHNICEAIFVNYHFIRSSNKSHVVIIYLEKNHEKSQKIRVKGTSIS